MVTEKKSINWKWTAPSGCNLILILDWLPLKLSFPDFRLTLNNETDQRKWILILSGKKKSLGFCQRCWKLDWLGAKLRVQLKNFIAGGILVVSLKHVSASGKSLPQMSVKLKLLFNSHCKNTTVLFRKNFEVFQYSRRNVS